MTSQVGRHEVNVVGQIFPGASHAFYRGLTAQLAFRSDFSRHSADFAGKRIQLVHHGIDGVFNFQDLSAYVCRDLLGQVAPGNSRSHLCNVAHLTRQVRCHEVDAVGQIFPGARNARHGRLSTQLALGANLSGDACYF